MTVKLVPLKFRSYIIDNYFVDACTGDIHSTKQTQPKRMTSTLDSSTGYMVITITDPSISPKQQVHRLVAETLVPFPCPVGISRSDWRATPMSVKNLLCSQYRVNHIDHDRTNYHPSNLEWVTSRQNSQKSVQHYAKS